MLIRFFKSSGGNVSILFGLMAMLLIGAVGTTYDFQRRFAIRDALQEIADTMAMRGAREFLLANASGNSVESLIEATAPSYFSSVGGPFSVETVINGTENSVTVLLDLMSPKTLLIGRLARFSGNVTVEATAVAVGGTNVCVISLNNADPATVSADGDAQLNAPDCSILANSTNSRAIGAVDNATVSADFICSSGGFFGSVSSFDPRPVTDCPAQPDPLAERQAPLVGACDFIDVRLSGRGQANHDEDTFTLDPGVYCGGIEIENNVSATLNPGTYIIKDGPLTVGRRAHVTGQYVSFYLDGDEAIFDFGPESHIMLSAEKTGLLTGLLFFEARDAPLGRRHVISSDDARALIGTIYLPRGNLEIASKRPVADQSAYTAIVVQKLLLTGGPTLVLNTDYAVSDIPTPDGIGPVGGKIILRD